MIITHSQMSLDLEEIALFYFISLNKLLLV